MADEKLKELLLSMSNHILHDEGLIEPKRTLSISSSSASEGGSVVVNPIPKKEQQPLEKDSKSLKIRTDLNQIDDDDDFNDYVIEPPLPPPKELDPNKLYALYEFHGDDPSHCELERDDALFLLSDQDNYWWLVRKEIDGKVGFAPAECLETYDERLARLNCWKNEELEKQNSHQQFSQTNSKSKSINTQSPSKKVVISDIITEYDDINHFNNGQEEEEEEEEEKSDSEFGSESDVQDSDYDLNEYNNETNEFNEHIDNDDLKGEEEDNQSTLKDDDNDNDNDNNDENDEHDEINHELNSEIASDFAPRPLIMTKKPKKINFFESPQESITSQFITSTPTESIEISPFIAPNASFFRIDNASGSIGTYSPSSSEFDSPGNTPPLNQFKKKPPPELLEHEKLGKIPLSKGTRDIANSMRMLDDLINEELNTTNSFDNNNNIEINFEDEDSSQDMETTITYDDEDPLKLSSPIELQNNINEKNLSNLTNSSSSNPSLHLLGSSSTTIDNFEEHDSDNEDADQFIQSHSKKIPRNNSLENTNSSTHGNSIHPEIYGLFKDSLSRIDDLTEQLKKLNEKLS
ncbi:hypothetical protein WICMUC_001589 [Wickerhamomyces mucosus]|uniref:SH3 domain-containing protein n=1 Tax=Wickerhamomyces mucosus TaxID=1378264 RepID=A0A9P8PTY4_9ASCO|nr:hypothetical protein WICMUC_001589 [Wickerhamomyces mucosus]